MDFGEAMSTEQIFYAVLGSGILLIIGALAFFLKNTFTDIKKELSQLNANVTTLIVQVSNSTLRHERTEAEITGIRQRIHHLENVVTQVSLIQQRCDHCSPRRD